MMGITGVHHHPLRHHPRFGVDAAVPSVTHSPGWHRTLKAQLSAVDYAKTREQYLSQRWQGLTQRLGFPVALAQKTFAELARLYESPSPQTGTLRVYHTLDHVVDCLAQWDAYQADATNPKVQNGDLLELSLWFHDAVDERNYPNGVPESAAMGEGFVAQSSDPQICAAQNTDYVRDLIMATHYSAPAKKPLTRDQQVLTDIDLSILGQSPTVYAQYAQDIRQEYAFVPDSLYRPGRAQVLQGLMKRQPFYQTPWGQRQFDAQAKMNLVQELHALIP